MKLQPGLNSDQFEKRYGMNRASFEFWLGDVTDAELTGSEIDARRARIAARKAARSQSAS